MLDWLIIGGGVQGTYFSNVLSHLLDRRGKNKAKIRVLDPDISPMFYWNHVTSNCGMTYLRSPRVHHIDLAANSLHEFSQMNFKSDQKPYLPPYSRPSLNLFQQHAQWVINKRKLEELRLLGRAVGIVERGRGLRVGTTSGDLDAKRILLCLGFGDQPYWPKWALVAKQKNGNLFHLLDRDFNHQQIEGEGKLVIVGGGLTAVQFALYQANETQREIDLILRHPITVNYFDSNPGWIGPKYLSSFHTINDYNLRRKIVNHARNRGSVPEEIWKALKSKITCGRINLIQSEIQSIGFKGSKMMHIAFKNWEEVSKARTIVLATGFNRVRPGGDFIKRLALEFGLSCSKCNYPIVSKSLNWHSRIFVSGALAELEIGPVSRNIIGARLVAKRLSEVI